MRKSKRTLALLLALLLVFGVLFGFGSTFLLARYPGHTCCGQRCLFCSVMNVVDVLLQHSHLIAAVSALFTMLSAAVLSRAIRVRICRLTVRTPITLKTKLLN